MSLLFTKAFSQRRTPQSKLQDLTLRGFGGGLNAVDDDFSMEPKYQVILNNFRRTPSGGQQKRFGSNWFADVHNVTAGSIMDMVYFNGRIVVVMDSGEAAVVDDAGNITALWNSTIASALPGAPSGWGNTYAALSFVPFKDTLAIHNGVDKPLSVSNAFQASYLQDQATGSNVNVPIGKYGCVASNYHCVAGISGLPTTIYISAVGTSGTFPGDPAPNDAITIDVGAYSPSGAISIRGLAGYRNFLIVFFQGQALLVTLGTYDSNNVHKPQFPDTLPKFGLLGHRCITPIEHDLVFTGLDGYSDAKRNLFSGLVTSDHVSDRIEPLYRKITGNLTDTQQQNNCFLVHDPLWHDTILFNPSGQHFVHTGSDNLHYSAWSTYSFPMTINAACSSFLGRLFYASGTRIYQHGNAVFDGENYNADKLNDRDAYWSTQTAFTAGQIVRDDSMNIIHESENLNTVDSLMFWSDFNSTTVVNLPIASPDPNGHSALWQRSSGAAGAWHGQEFASDSRISQQLGPFYNKTALPFVYSVYATPGLTGTPARYLVLYMSDGSATAQLECTYDMQTGTVSIAPHNDGPTYNFTNLSAGMVAAPNGFWRCWLAFTTPSEIPTQKLRPFLSFNTNNIGLFGVDGATDTTGVIYGMQLEQRTVMGPYVPTRDFNVLPSANKSYTALVNHTSGKLAFAYDVAKNPNLWQEYKGLPIDFDMELPWLSGKDPMKVKQLRFLSVGTIGGAEFTVDVYVDGLYKDDDGNVIFNPALSLPMIGGSAKGFGFDAGPYGGGRRSDDPRLYGFPAKFKLLKVRYSGSSTRPLQIVNTSFLYSRGRYKR